MWYKEIPKIVQGRYLGEQGIFPLKIQGTQANNSFAVLDAYLPLLAKYDIPILKKGKEHRSYRAHLEMTHVTLPVPWKHLFSELHLFGRVQKDTEEELDFREQLDASATKACSRPSERLVVLSLC